MRLRRLATVVLSVTGALLLAAVLYLALADLGRHKARVEVLVSERIGRPFAIHGELSVRLVPEVSLLAERVRLGNAQWGSKPQMVEVGRFATRIGLWSLVSGPIDVRSFELSEVAVLLEKDRDGNGNWELGGAAAPEAGETSLGPKTAKVPLVIEHGKLDAVQLIYREPGKPDRVALLETMSIEIGTNGLIALSGKGKLDEYPTTLAGELGPLHGLVAGRDIRLTLQAAIGNLRLEAKGSIGRLEPLDGADLALKIENPDLGAMLKKLHLPVFATGALDVDARLKDAGELNRLDVDAKLGEITARVNGTLRTLGLPGADLKFEALVADLARLAANFGVKDLPAGALNASGRVVSTRTEITLDAINAAYAGAKARADGTIRVNRDPSAAVRFQVAAESLARLRPGLPEIPFSLNGNYAGARGKAELRNLKGRIGESEISGRVSLVRAGKGRIDAELASPSLDLTPFAAGAGDKPVKEEPKKFVFNEEPLPLDALKGPDAKVHVAIAELKFAAGVLKDVDGVLVISGGRLTMDGRAKDTIEGSLDGAIDLAAAREGAADVNAKVRIRNLRTGLGAGKALEPSQGPPTSVEMSLTAKGGSARQMASSANGRLLLTQGAGKVERGLIGMVGGDLLNELAGKLNPFAAQDPHTQLECTVVKADIVDGQVTVKPVLLQSQKVTVVADGKIDLHTEQLSFGFGTRPRAGVGVSAGMFANPFLELAGTLASPRLGVGAKGATSAGAAAATGGLSLLVQGLVDRLRGAQDLCKKTLDEAAVGLK